jgi:GH25 family lysozyme M1 (1,4-beta-N-acetylmuramidase)
MKKTIAYAALLLAAALTASTAVAQRPLGIDVSSYQGSGINWGSVRGGGISFAWAKATEGTTFTDPDFGINQNNGKNAGVLMGAYHFARPNQDNPGSEAAHFWNVAHGFVLADGRTIMPMLDMEIFSGVIGASSYSDWANQWCNIIVGDANGQGVKVRPSIYTSSCSACNFNGSVSGWIPWLANYNGQSAFTGNPWNVCTSCEVWGPGVWDVWQCSSTASVPGVPGNVDLDVFNGNSSQMVSTLLVNVACDESLVGGAIRAHYDSLGACSSFLGAPTTPEQGTPDGVGRYNHFANNGSIYWTSALGAWSIHGNIQDHWSAMGWETSPMGYPTTDETGTPDGIGRYNHFNKNGDIGSIYYTTQTGAWSLHGNIRIHWADLGYEQSPVGYPTSDETGTPDNIGRYNHFLNLTTGSAGSIYWTPNYGAWSIHGAIRTHWANLGWEASVVGYPVTDETGTPDGIGRYNHFQNPRINNQGGSIYYTAATGAQEVHGPIRTYWANAGWEKGPLGYPTSDQYAVSGSPNLVRNNFQHGTATLNTTTGVVTSP